MSKYVIGIDIGTGSARAGIFDFKGKRLGVGVQPTKMWKPEPDFAEHSSADIWKSVCKAVKAALRQANISSNDVSGIAFDATCSLVAIDKNDNPVTLSPTGKDEQNIIVWLDHRAMAEAGKLTNDGHDVLRYLGGVVSPEHEIPKLMWVRKNLPQSWKRTAKFFDLADWLTYVCTGNDVRSLCTTVCKWTYLAHEKEIKDRWSREFFRQNGILDLLTDEKIGVEVEPMGRLAGPLQSRPARELGLPAGIAVGVGIIDAHAGGLGVLGMGGGRSSRQKNQLEEKKASRTAGDFDDVLCLIGGTSSCHMVVSRNARFVSGVWGPYYSAMLPDYWLNEGGQSATGALLDFVITTHAHYSEALKSARKSNQSIYEYLNQQVDRLAKEEKLRNKCETTSRLHVLDYFHGNRSPKADPMARGAIHGLALHADLDDLTRIYYATIQSIAYGTRDIIDALNRKGYSIRRIHACGGGTKNLLWLQEHADITGCEIHLPKEPEAVLLGSAILAAVGAGKFSSIPEAMTAMSHAGGTIKPRPATYAYHDKKMAIYRELYKDQKKYEKLLDSK